MKKIFASIFIFSICMGLFNIPVFTTNSDTNKLAKNIIFTKKELSKISSGEKYIQAFDSFVKKASVEKLQEIGEKIQRLISKGKISPDDKKMYNIVMYLHFKIQYRLLTNKEGKKEERQEENFEAISQIEKDTIKKELLELQKHILENPKDILVNLSKDIEKNLNIEERGDFEFMLNLDHKKTGTLKYILQLEDYIIKNNSQFDKTLNSHVSSDLEFNLENQKEPTELKISGEVEQISKDGETYIGINNLDISKQNNIDNKLQDFIDILQKIANENNFVKITESNHDTKMIMNFLQSINPKNINSKLNKISTTALLEAYGKTDEGYLLQPTRFACSNSLETIFNIFETNTHTCSEKEYQELIDSFKENGTLFLKIDGNIKTLTFKGNTEQAIILGEVKYDTTKIQSLSFHAEPTDPSLKEEFITFKYVTQNSLMFASNLKDGDFTIKFDSKLNKDNKFSFAKLELDDKDGGNTISAKLENNKITGNFEFLKKRYDYTNEDWNKIDTYKLEGSINGSTKYDNTFSNLDIQFSGTDLLKNKKDTSGNIFISDTVLKFLLNGETESEKGYIDIIYNYDKNYLPINGKAKIQLWKKDSSIDNETYKIIYTGDFKKIFDMDIDISQRTISGATIIPKYLTINHKGFISKQDFELKNNYKFESKFIEMINTMQDTSRMNNAIRKNNIRTLQTALETYYSDNGKYPGKAEIESEEFKSLFLYTPKDPLGNVEIDGCKFGYKYQLGQDSYKLSTCLEGKKEKFETGNISNFEIIEDFYINGYTSWETKTSNTEENKITSLEGIFNIQTAISESKTKLNMYFDLLLDNRKVIDFKLKNDSNKRKIDYIDIQVPENYIHIDEIFE